MANESNPGTQQQLQTPTPGFEWIDIYEKIAQKIRQEKTFLSDLFKILKGKTYGNNRPIVTNSLKGYSEIDPFSFFALLNHDENKRISILKILLEDPQFGLSNFSVPSKLDGIPSIRNAHVNYPGKCEKTNKRENVVSALWNLFNCAMDFASDKRKQSEFVQSYDAVKEMYSDGWLTTTSLLYEMSPRIYLPLDEKTSSYLKKASVLESIEKPLSAEEYLRIMNTVKMNFGKGGLKDIQNFPQLSHCAYETTKKDQRTDETNEESPESANLKKKFKEWLPLHGVKIAITDYIGCLEAIGPDGGQHGPISNRWYQLIQDLTGKTPPYGVFDVPDLETFNKWYSPSYEVIMCDQSEKDALKTAFKERYPGGADDKQFDTIFDFLHGKTESNRRATAAAIKRYVEFLCVLVSNGKFPLVYAGVPRLNIPHSELKDEDGNTLSRNLIYFGAPGTGKSHQLKKEVEAERHPDGSHIQDGEDGSAIDYERVTFYPTYSYAQFVGCYKPVMESTQATEKLSSQQLAQILKRVSKVETGMKEAAILLFAEQYYDSLLEADIGDIVEQAGLAKKNENSHVRATLAVGKRLVELRGRSKAGRSQAEIAYKFVPGPFLRVLVNALNEKPGEDGKKKNWCLVIEEINRANAAAVFGDVFQLLDRNDKGESEYDVAASEDIRKYLAEVITSQEAREFLAVKTDDKGNWTECQLRIPSNMYIWATMNSADQGVFPMDTAFKRRWKFKYFEINQSDDKIEKRTIGTNLTIDGKSVYTESNWSNHMKNWNNVRKFVNRLLVLFKVNEDKLMGPWFVQPERDDVISAEQFESKVLMYLWEDAARMCRQKMFPNSVTSYSELITEWRKRGVGIFDHLMGDNQIGRKDNNTDNSATKLWCALDMPKQQQ